jgi:hypothetical protein
MSGFIRTLSIILILQVALASYLQFSKTSISTPQDKVPLLASSLTDPDQIIIRDGEKNSITLRKISEKWVLPDTNDFPASGSRVAEFLGALKIFQKGWPVGTSDIAARQFKVSSDVFERKIDLEKGKDKASLFLGSSPGFKKVYARVDGSQETYSIEFSTYQAGSKLKDWYDSNFAKRDKATIQEIALNDITIARQEETLVLNGIPDSKETNTEELQKLIGKVSGIFVTDVLGIEEKPEYGLSSPLVSLSLTYGDNKKETFSFAIPAGDDVDYAVLKIDSSPYFLKVPKSLPGQLNAITASKLVQDIKKEMPATPENEEGSSATDSIVEEASPSSAAAIKEKVGASSSKNDVTPSADIESPKTK